MARGLQGERLRLSRSRWRHARGRQIVASPLARRPRFEASQQVMTTTCAHACALAACDETLRFAALLAPLRYERLDPEGRDLTKLPFTSAFIPSSDCPHEATHPKVGRAGFLVRGLLTHRSSPLGACNGRSRPRRVAHATVALRHSMTTWLFALTASLASAIPARAQSVDQTLWGADANRLYPAGSFARIGLSPVGLMAAVELADAPAAPPANHTSVLRAFDVSNPSRSSGLIHFSLGSSATVDLEVFDMQGRRVRKVLTDSPRAAGEHELPVDLAGLPPGFYLHRLTAGAEQSTRKMIVLP